MKWPDRNSQDSGRPYVRSYPPEGAANWREFVRQGSFSDISRCRVSQKLIRSRLTGANSAGRVPGGGLRVLYAIHGEDPAPHATDGSRSDRRWPYLIRHAVEDSAGAATVIAMQLERSEEKNRPRVWGEQIFSIGHLNPSPSRARTFQASGNMSPEPKFMHTSGSRFR